MITAVPALAAATDLTSLPLEDLLRVEITTASKYKQDARETPSQVQVITADEIRRYGWRTIAEALNSLPGFYTSDDGLYQYMGARGFLTPGDYSTRFQLLLNGQRLNDNVFEQAQFGYPFPIDMALIDRIEVIAGPGSAIYGSNALFGVINVIARQPSGQRSSSGSAGLTTNGWRELRAATSTRLGEDGPHLIASFSYADKGAQDIMIPAARGVARQSDLSLSPDGVARGLDSGKLARAYVAVQQSGLQASAWATQRDLVPPMALYGVAFNERRNTVHDGSYGVMASLDRALEDDLQFNGRIAYQEQVFRTNYVYAGVPVSMARDDVVGGWLSGESRFVYSGFASHKLVFGADLQRDMRLAMRNLDASGTPALDVRDRTWRSGFYVQDEWAIAPRWRLSAGARYDRYSIDLSHTSPRLGLVHTLSDATTIKLLAGEAYRVPNTFERLYADGTYYLANPALRPEVIRTVEGIVEHRIGSDHQVGVSVYRYDFRDQIGQTDLGNDQTRYENKPRTTVQGGELYWRGTKLGRGSLFASLGLNEARNEAAARLPNSPGWIAKLRAAHPLAGPAWQAALELDAIGPRYVADGDTVFRLQRQWWMNAVVNATALAPGVHLQLRIVNLFDRLVQIPVAEAAAPLMPLSRRAVQLVLSHDF